MKMMKLLLNLILASVLSANTYIVVDIAQGLKKSEFNELGKMAYPDKKLTKSIYEDEEKVYLFAFNETNTLSNSFIYRPKNKAENSWKEASSKYTKFFGNVKKAGVKKNKYVKSNIIFLVDTSGSMKTDDVIGQVKNTMRYLVKAKSKKSQIAIVTFDGKKGMQSSKQAQIIQGFSSSKNKAYSSIDSIKASKYDTFLGAGLSKVQSLLTQAKKNTLIILFTDGKAVNDENKALKIVRQFKSSKVKLKVVAVGGADVEMLKRFSTTGYVFNATSNDLNGMAYGMSVGSDEIFLRINNLLENKGPLNKNDTFILYSSMMNVDDSSDFFIVPNIASNTFYKEVHNINVNRGVKARFNGAKVYIRVLGKMSASKENKLKQFWKRYFKDSGAEVVFFANSTLSASDLK